MVRTETEFEKALRIKGFAFKKEGKYYSNLERKRADLHLIEIKSLASYVEEISKLDSSFESPVFYRGQTNANYLQIPSIMRGHLNYEKKMIDMFMQRFPNEFKRCATNIDRLCLMQHFGLYTRFLDISENPFAALYFACQPMKKFGDPNGNFDKYGEIFVYKEKEFDNIKYSNSRTSSIIASTAFQETVFNFKVLENTYRNDTLQFADLPNFIEFLDVLSRSVIVRTKKDNPRIINQQGAFILCNANKIRNINGFSDNDLIKFMNYLVEHPKSGINLDPERLKKTPFENLLKNKTTWDVVFEKLVPYDVSNPCVWMRQDPYSLEKIFYKDKNSRQVIFLISPEAKRTILKDLDKFNITEDFIYPDMDNVANELNIRWIE